MPNFQPQAAAIRASGYSIRCYASFYAPDPIIEATCSLASPSYPLAVLFVTIDTGDYTDILPGMRVDVLDSTGTYLKARTRIRFGNENTSTVFHVREFSQAALDIAVGDRVFVYPDIRLADKLVEANEWFNPDGTAASDNGSNPPPLARSGGHYAGRVDDGQTFATVAMTGSNSDVVDPDSTPGNVSHLWTLPSGVAFQAGSGSTDADPVLEADVGQHLILHTVTDDDNSKTTTQAVVVIVTDDSTPPNRVIVSSYEGKPEAGFNGEVEVVSGSVDTASIPDGCLCILWGRERIQNAWQSIRNNSDGREHILAVGYVRRERTRRAADGVNHLSFEFTSPLSRLREITAYSKVMEENASPDAWNEIKTLGVQRAYLQLIQFYSTLVESGFDLLIDADFLDERYPAFYLQRSTIAGMLDELAHGQDARTTCDRTGQFSLHTEPPFIPYGDRSGITVSWALTAQDILDVEVNIDHYPTVELYKTSGFSGGASGNAPVFSLYPGDAPGEGIQTPTRDRLIVDATTPQTDLNERTGRYGALADRVLVDGDGNRSPAAEVTLTLRGAYNFFDFRKEYVTLTDDYGRRLFSGARFYPTSVSVSFDGRGAASTSVTLMQETNAPAGSTFTPPSSNEIPIPGGTLPPSPPIGLPDFPGMIGRGTADMALLCINGLVLTENFQAASPTWAFGSWASLSVSGSFLLWVPDGFAPGEGWVFTTTKIYRLVLATGVATLLHSWSTTLLTVSADASISEEGFVVAVAYVQGSGSIAAYATDGATFTEVVLNTAYATDGATYVPNNGCRIDSVNAGTVYTSIYTTTGSIASGTVVTAGRRSTNYGATWSAWSDIAADADILAQTIFTPFPLANIVYYSRKENGACDEMRVTNGSAVSISPQISGENYSHVGARDGISASPQNRLRMIMIGEETTGGQYAGFLTNDGGDSWAVILAKGTAARHCALFGNDQNLGLAWGGSSYLVQLAITGSTATATDKSGNLASLSASSIIAIAGA